MDVYEKYFFDVNGYLVVEDILSADQVAALNEAIDHNRDNIRIREGQLRLSGGAGKHGGGVSLALEGAHGRGDIGSILRWPKPWCQPFRNLLAHPKIIPYLNTLFGRGWKLDHGVDVLVAESGCEGLKIHGSGNATFNGSRYYHYHNGRMRSGLIVCQFAMADVDPGAGGLCVIPGSHKANLPCPEDILTWEANQDLVHHIVQKAGDLVIFNEATAHGTLPWRGRNDRRVALYRYTPKYLHYAGGIYEANQPEWTSELTEAQRAVLEPPYIYHHPLVEDDGETVVRPRREGE